MMSGRTYAAAVALIAAFGAGITGASAQDSADRPQDEVARDMTVATIYFPSWHADDHYSAWYGEGWNEWKLLESNPERFPGHHRIQPAKDWGYFDEADPQWMAKQIDLAVEHGVDVFIFDWYWYSGAQILHRPVEEALPQTPNRDKIKYALMWADHTWVDYFPYPYDLDKLNWLLPIRHTAANFERVMAHCIKKHFSQPNYWRLDGGLYFSLFAPEEFIRQLGGAEAARKVLDAARQQVRDAGLGELHLVAYTGIPQSIADIEKAGFDSMTSYNVTTMSSGLQLPDQPFEPYEAMIERHESYWDNMDTGVLPYAPVVTVGWDVTPRWEQDVPWPPQKNHYPYTPTITGNTPEKFGDLVRRALRHAETSERGAPYILINAWNEWTEGSSLLPSEKYGDGYLRELSQAVSQGAATEVETGTK